MKAELLKELIEETEMNDIAERYQNVAAIIGIEKFVQLADYARGDEIYFPKAENIIAPARNRRIKAISIHTTRKVVTAILPKNRS